MSKPTPEQRRRRYLASLFALNPLWQAPELLTARRAALGITRFDADEAPAASDQRDASGQIRRHIEQIQQQFWSLPLDELKSRLSAIASRKAPEFAPIVKRLGAVASCRGAFPELAQHKKMDLALFDAFKTSVVLPPTDAGYVKERFLYSLRDAQQVKRAKRSAELVRDGYPLLYALEREWFETILKTKKPRRAPAAKSQVVQQESSEGGFPTWTVVMFGIIALRVLLKFLATRD